MALRAFHSNPCIGGFGGESSSLPVLLDPSGNHPKTGQHGRSSTGGSSSSPQDGDAFCQIIKELVDNAVDACSTDGTGTDTGTGSGTANPNPNQRVKVEIQPCNNLDSSRDDESLQVTISDNGCGMVDIQACVDAFQSTKNMPSTAAQTAGRYGIGLTLCLVHGQRLVPKSYACITSATRDATHFTRAFYIVDTEGDSVNCRKQEQIKKTHPFESGTCVSLLVPGGLTAQLAWPRLENYFLRFQMSLGLHCSLEVLAPTLSKLPIFVRQLQEASDNDTDPVIDEEDEEAWVDNLEDTVDQESQEKDEPVVTRKSEPQRKAIHKAVQTYLQRSIQLGNVAHSIQPIRLLQQTGSASSEPANTTPPPQLQVDMIVCGPNDDSDDTSADEPVATLKLIRMVNRIPLLDGAEAAACGLVQGMSNKQIWGSFGLSVGKLSWSSSDDQACWVPTFEVQDSDQVAPFFQSQTHALWEPREDHDDDGDTDDIEARFRRKRKQASRSWLLPAKVRLGEIIVIVQIHADPLSLPLPTLSKGRLPLNHRPIDQALHVGLRDCLRSLQTTNPELLLTPRQLRRVEREARYVPATATAVSCVLSKLSNPHTQERLFDIIRQWRQEATASNGPLDGQVDRHVPLEQASIATLIEKRLKQAIQNAEEARKPAKRAPGGLSKKGRKSNEEEGYGDLDDHSDEKGNKDDDSSKEEEKDKASSRSESDRMPKENSPSRQSQSWRESSASSEEEEGYADLDDHSDQKENKDADSSKEEENDNASYSSESEQLPKENPASRQSQSWRENSASSVSSVEQESVGKRLRSVLAAKITAEPEEVESDDEWW